MYKKITLCLLIPTMLLISSCGFRPIYNNNKALLKIKKTIFIAKNPPAYHSNSGFDRNNSSSDRNNINYVLYNYLVEYILNGKNTNQNNASYLLKTAVSYSYDKFGDSVNINSSVNEVVLQVEFSIYDNNNRKKLINNFSIQKNCSYISGNSFYNNDNYKKQAINTCTAEIAKEASLNIDLILNKIIKTK